MASAGLYDDSFLCGHSISLAQLLEFAKLVFTIATMMFEKPLNFVAFLLIVIEQLEAFKPLIEEEINSQKTITYRCSEVIAGLHTIISNIDNSITAIKAIITMFDAEDMELQKLTISNVPKIKEEEYRLEQEQILRINEEQRKAEEEAWLQECEEYDREQELIVREQEELVRREQEELVRREPEEEP